MANRRNRYLAQVEQVKKINERMFNELAEPAVQRSEHMIWNQTYVPFTDPIRGERLVQVVLGNGGDDSLVELREHRSRKNDGLGYTLFSGHINPEKVSMEEFPSHLDWVAAKETALIQAIKNKLPELVKVWKNQTVEYFEDLAKTMPPWEENEVADFVITAQDVNALGGDTRYIQGTFAEADAIAMEMWRSLQHDGGCIASVVISDGEMSYAR